MVDEAQSGGLIDYYNIFIHAFWFLVGLASGFYLWGIK